MKLNLVTDWERQFSRWDDYVTGVSDILVKYQIINDLVSNSKIFQNNMLLLKFSFRIWLLVFQESMYHFCTGQVHCQRTVTKTYPHPALLHKTCNCRLPMVWMNENLEKTFLNSELSSLFRLGWSFSLRKLLFNSCKFIPLNFHLENPFWYTTGEFLNSW